MKRSNSYQTKGDSILLPKLVNTSLCIQKETSNLQANAPYLISFISYNLLFAWQGCELCSHLAWVYTTHSADTRLLGIAKSMALFNMANFQ